MAYGSGYQPREYNQVVPEGDYRVCLGMPQDVVRGGYNIREIPIEISGYKGYSPTHWSWFDAPEDMEKLEKWRKARTRDADAFGVNRGDFNPASWCGKVGVVHIGKDKNGYMQVQWSVPPNASAPAQSAVPMQQGRDYPPPNAPHAGPALAPGGNNFTDDIPF